MSQSFCRIPFLLLVAFGLMVLTGTFARAAAGTGAVGVLDLSVVQENAAAYKIAMGRWQKFIQARRDRLEALQGGLGLNTEQFQEYIGLAGHPPVRTNEPRIKELEGIAKKNLDEYDSYKEKTDLTDEQKKRVQSLNTDLKSVTAIINDESGHLESEVQGEKTRYMTLLDGMVDKSVAKVAQAKKLQMVVTKDVQDGNGGMARFVIWGGTDITQDVIKSLNDDFKESMLDAPKTNDTATPNTTMPAAPMGPVMPPSR